MLKKNENPFFVKEKKINIIDNGLDEINNAFDIYSLQKNKNIIYLCGPNGNWRENLDIFEFKDEEFHKKLSLKIHKESIEYCKYFLNKKNKKEYLVSIDKGNGSAFPTTIICSILDENNYQTILNFNNYRTIIYPFTLIFNENNILFYIYSCSFTSSEIVSERKEIYKKINLTKGVILHYIIWENVEKNKNLVIQSNESSVYIYDIFAPDLNLIKIKDNKLKGNNYSCIILYNKDNTDILCILNEQGNIIFYDLFEDKITCIVSIKDNKLAQIRQFNEKYLIVLSRNGFFIVLDYDNKKVISKISSKEINDCKTMKILNHHIYGKYILIGGFMEGITIFKNISYSFNQIKLTK